MTGPATTVPLNHAGLARGTGAQLARFAREHDVPLVAVVSDFSAPEVLVAGPVDRVPWAPADLEDRGYLLLTGTWSAERWQRTGATPLLPEGAAVSGTTAPPPGADTVQ